MPQEQLSLFSFLYRTKYIGKPIRLIELFAGVGSQHKALKEITDQVECYRTCEWAINSILAYGAVHFGLYKPTGNLDKDYLADKLFELGVSLDYNQPAKKEQLKRLGQEKLNLVWESIQKSNNLVNIMNTKGEDLGIVDTDKYEYIMTYSFPCQDLSLAGKRAGMSTSQADGGTRSGLLWEVERLLEECENKPQILLMENVPQVIQSGAIKDFQKWETKLGKLGYKNYIKVLNAKDYGIPQNRQRCFMVSILGDYAYSFPVKTQLKYRLKDFLENEVNEKYYLSEKMTKYISATGTKKFSVNNSEINCSIARPLTTEQNKRAGTTNYVCDDLPENADLKKVELKRGYSCSVKTDEPETSNIDVLGNYSKSNFTQTSIVNKNGIAPTVTENHGQVTAIAIKTNNKQGYLLAKDGDGVDISSRMETHRGTVQNGVCHTIDTQSSASGVVVDEIEVERESNLRIRKLTPLECCKLMGFERKDYNSMVNVGLSDSAIYHICGDSIVVAVLISIFAKMFTKEIKIEDYVERIKNEKENQ